MDIFTDELEAALAGDGCPLCRVDEIDQRRWMETFVREAHNDAGVREQFQASKGFCPLHAGLFSLVAHEHAALAVVATVYAVVIDEDLRRLWSLREQIRHRIGRKPRAQAALATCPACLRREASTERKVYFFCRALDDESFRSRYALSAGLCASHFSTALKEAEQRHASAYGLLLDDWIRRLAALRRGMSEFDRKRDHRFAHEPRGEEQDAPLAALRHYAGTTATGFAPSDE